MRKRKDASCPPEFQTQTEISRERTWRKQSEAVYLFYYDYKKKKEGGKGVWKRKDKMSAKLSLYFYWKTIQKLHWLVIVGHYLKLTR